MRKKFVSKKRKTKKLILTIIIIIILYEIISNLFLNFQLASSNEEFLKLMLKDSNHHLLYKKSNNFFSKLVKGITSIDSKNPINLLENVFKYKNNNNENMYVYEETDSDSLEITDKNSKYINDPIKENISDPLVYIYNTHQLENYSSKNYENYNITPNVMMASYILREKLNKKNIKTLVDTNNITDFLNTHGFDYASSYVASRYYLKDALLKNKNLKLIIDIHRDSINRNSSTVEINNKKYAKVLFVVGLKNKNYQKNLKNVTKLNNLILKKYPKLTRGILKKEGKNVNGVYNQDLSEKIILIECGGKENNIEEVLNTLELLADIIEEYIGE